MSSESPKKDEIPTESVTTRPTTIFAKPSARTAVLSTGDNGPSSTFATASSTTTRAGIQAVHVNAAREMVSLHTRGRLPSNRAIGSTGKPSSSAQASGPFASATSRSTTTRITPTSIQSETSSSSMRSSFPFSSAPGKSVVTSHHSHSTNISVPAKDDHGECNNPQCEHCGQVIIPSPQASFPIQDRPSISINDWSIFTQKRPILNSQELDYLSENRFDFPLPEMIFGNNLVKIVNHKTGEAIEFNALDALDSLDSDCKLKVSYHQEWLNSRRSKSSSSSEKSEKALKENSTKDLKTFTDNLDTLKPYDWTYSPNYKGTTTNLQLHPSSEEIPVKKLLRQDPILFYDESILFEDELGDNGISMLSTKIRVMPTCLLLLCRFFLRIDNVIFRIRDTRVFVDFETNQLIREHKEQEFPYDDLLKKITSSKTTNTNDPKKLLRDTNWVSQNIPVVSTVIESNRVPEGESGQKLNASEVV
ncbi:TIP41-like family-domain-containing protein [Scheffersomyces xylosifermentans]|uniref:TIP41-like family-domain-containing protein n=1 Tax=Scheffersomyces xylosifermentans TaxID=1304137 RepID=UPI00315DFF3C